MAPVAAELRFFVDESLMGLGKALSFARRDVVHAGHPLVPEGPLGATDEAWIPLIAGRDLIVLGRDRHMRTRPGEIALWKAHGLRVLYIAGKKDLSNWEYLGRLIRRWDEVELSIQTGGVGPWLFYILDRSVRPIPI